MATAATSGSATRSAPRRQEAGCGRSVLPPQRHPSVSAPTTAPHATRQLEAAARAMMLFSCIPLPTIRAQLSKQIDEASYGSIFAWLQTAMALTDVIATLTYNSLYIAFLKWDSGFSLLLAAAVCWLSTLPVVVYSYRLRRRDDGLDSDTHSFRRMVIDDFDECSTASSQRTQTQPTAGSANCSSGE